MWVVLAGELTGRMHYLKDGSNIISQTTSFSWNVTFLILNQEVTFISLPPGTDWVGSNYRNIQTPWKWCHAVLGTSLGRLDSFPFLSHGYQTSCKKCDYLTLPCCKKCKLCGLALRGGTLCGETNKHWSTHHVNGKPLTSRCSIPKQPSWGVALTWAHLYFMIQKWDK